MTQINIPEPQVRMEPTPIPKTPRMRGLLELDLSRIEHLRTPFDVVTLTEEDAISESDMSWCIRLLNEKNLYGEPLTESNQNLPDDFCMSRKKFVMIAKALQSFVHAYETGVTTVNHMLFINLGPGTCTTFEIGPKEK